MLLHVFAPEPPAPPLPPEASETTASAPATNAPSADEPPAAYESGGTAPSGVSVSVPVQIPASGVSGQTPASSVSATVTDVSKEPVPSAIQPQPQSRDEELLNMSDDEFIAFARKVKKQGVFDEVPDWYAPDDFGVKREGSGDAFGYERWNFVRTSSATSLSHAEQIVLQHYGIIPHDDGYTNESIIAHSIDFVGENDYYYSFRLRYTTSSSPNAVAFLGFETRESVMRVNVFKDEALHINIKGWWSPSSYTANPSLIVKRS
ncbi:MAG: hypothetical protein FWD35_05125 [Oscillospiraceae bacterium]|nr:hypothetical protein [Oscillospiraceae bacterium]